MVFYLSEIVSDQTSYQQHAIYLKAILVSAENTYLEKALSVCTWSNFEMFSSIH